MVELLLGRLRRMDTQQALDVISELSDERMLVTAAGEGVQVVEGQLDRLEHIGVIQQEVLCVALGVLNVKVEGDHAVQVVHDGL